MVEVLWLQIVQELRKLGLPLNNIRTTKAYFFERYYDSTAIPYLDYYLTTALGLNKPVYMGVFPDGKSEFFEYIEYQNALTLQLLGAHVNLSMNDMLVKIRVNKEINPQFPIEMSEELAKIFEFFNEEEFESATVHKKSGEIDRIELNQKQTADTRVHELLTQSDNQDIMIKKRQGQVILIERANIKKL